MSTKAMNEEGEEKAQGSVVQHIFYLVFLAGASEKGTQLIFVLSSLTYSIIMSLSLLTPLTVL